VERISSLTIHGVVFISFASQPGLPDDAKFGKYCQKSLLSKTFAIFKIPIVTKFIKLIPKL